MEIYLENTRFDRLAEAVAALEPCPFTGKVTADQVKLVLGEQGNIWPASILPDVFEMQTGGIANG